VARLLSQPTAQAQFQAFKARLEEESSLEEYASFLHQRIPVVSTERFLSEATSLASSIERFIRTVPKFGELFYEYFPSSAPLPEQLPIVDKSSDEDLRTLLYGNCHAMQIYQEFRNALEQCPELREQYNELYQMLPVINSDNFPGVIHFLSQTLERLARRANGGKEFRALLVKYFPH
jgi:hypothetical protein